MDEALIEWIRAGLEKPGKTKGGLANALGRSGSAVTALLNGSRTVKTFEVPKIAAYLGEAPPGIVSEVTAFEGELVPVRVAGIVEAGSFREANEFVEYERVTLWEPRDERFPQARLMAFTVSGDSMNDLKVDGRPKPILEGDRVICVDFSDLGGRVPIQDGMVVVVERVRDGGHLREWSVKQVEYYADRIEFWPRSTNPKHKPIIVPHERDRDDGMSVEILGLVQAVRTEMRW